MAKFSGQLLVELIGFSGVSTVVSKCLAGSNLHSCMLRVFVRRSIRCCTVSSPSLLTPHKSSLRSPEALDSVGVTAVCSSVMGVEI